MKKWPQKLLILIYGVSATILFFIFGHLKKGMYPYEKVVILIVGIVMSIKFIIEVVALYFEYDE